MRDEIEQTAARLEKIKSASQEIVAAASSLQETADSLQDEVSSLTKRIDVLEFDNLKVADELVHEAERVEVRQVKQDGRLDDLES